MSRPLCVLFHLASHLSLEAGLVWRAVVISPRLSISPIPSFAPSRQVGICLVHASVISDCSPPSPRSGVSQQKRGVSSKQARRQAPSIPHDPTPLVLWGGLVHPPSQAATPCPSPPCGRHPRDARPRAQSGLSQANCPFLEAIESQLSRIRKDALMRLYSST